MFFNRFDEELRDIFNNDKDKYMVISWIIFNTNYQDRYKGLNNLECYFSYSIVESDCNVKRSKLQRIMKELEKDNIINWVLKSKTKHQESILKLLKIDTVKDTVEDTVKPLKTQGFEVDGDTVNNTVKDTSSINLSKNQSNIKRKANTKPNNIPVIDLTVNKVKIEKVRLTVDQYKSLVTDYSKSIIDDEVLNLDNYIINGKGEKYKDHNRVLRTWINRKRKDITQSELVQANKVYQRPL